jgi:UDP-N-acetylglucosamine--N-acetylmuramyl-(pentapeptide) pyrophosphoryl-undecaprenol N-acetylglucosamine transferase
MRVLIMAGGTGGHVFPALTIARGLQAKGIEVIWLGTKNGLEAEKVPSAGIPIFYITTAGIRGKSLWKKIQVIGQLSKALYQSLRIIVREKPDAVLGMGGFVSGPGGLAAWLLRKPLVIHEQNAIAGFTNRCLARLATQIFSAFPNAFPKNIPAITVGNPVHEQIAALPIPAGRFAQRNTDDPIRILIIGGSLGAQAINTVVPAAVALLPIERRPVIRHQTGVKHLAETQAAYAAATVDADTIPFIEHMAEAYAWADFVICRAGALTVSELAAAGVGSLFIPYPYAVDDHQSKNGMYLVQAGGALLISQAELTAQRLADLMTTVCSDRGRLLKMAEAARAQRNIAAADQVIQFCVNLGKSASQYKSQHPK